MAQQLTRNEARITYVPIDPDYLREMETAHWWDGILTSLLIVGFAIGLAISAVVK